MSGKQAGEWDFDGACDPAKGYMPAGQQTFTLGIFQWIPKAGGRGLKRGKVVERVRGSVYDAEAVREKARDRVAFLNSPTAREQSKP